MIYICERCNYNTLIKKDLYRHYNKQIQCISTKLNLTKEELLNNFKKYEIEKFKCKKCFKVFKNDKNLNRHIEKKICIKNDKNKVNIDNICCKCNKSFINKYTLHRHLNKLICIKNIDTYGIVNKVGDKTIINYNTTQIINNNQINNNQINNNQIENQTNNPVITLNNFGSEKTDYLDAQYFYNLVKDFTENAESMVRDSIKLNTSNIGTLIKDIHFNKEHLENNNIIPLNFNKEQYKIYNDGNYIIKTKEDVFKTILNNIMAVYNNGLNNLINICFNSYKKNKNNINNDRLKIVSNLNSNLNSMNKYIKELDNYEKTYMYKDNLYFKYVKESYNLLYKNLDVIAKTYKIN